MAHSVTGQSRQAGQCGSWFQVFKADDSLMIWSHAGFRNDAWFWAAVSASRGPWKEMYRHTRAIGGVMRSAHAVPQPGVPGTQAW
jgi:hypothetical protein